MPQVTAIQSNFTAGEISPYLFSRIDLEKYRNGCYTLQNFIAQRYGGIRKRGGTEFINEVKDSSKSVRLVNFVYSVTQAYVLEFGDLYVRFYTNGGILESSPGVPVEVVTPYDQNEIWDLQFAQSADVLYIVHPDFAPRTLSRTSATTFVLDEMDFEDGPYLDLNDTATTMTPASFGSITPTMSGLTAPSGTVSTASGAADAWEVFDRNVETDSTLDGGSTGYVQYQQAGGAQVIADAYYLTAAKNVTNSQDMPTIWQFQGSNNGSTWTTLDSRQGETGWQNSETRYYEFENSTAYEYYRLNFQGGGGPDANSSDIAEIGIHRKATDQTAFNLTASAVTGINDGVGFVASDVGRPIRLLGSDGRWRWARIIARTSSTIVTIQLYDHALPDLTAIINWRMGAWSDTTGWPGAIEFFAGRLCFARTATQPQTVWMSEVDDFTSFHISDPLVDSDAIEATITSGSINEVKWLAEGTALFAGTTAAVRTFGPSSTQAAVSPTNIQQRRETNFGASALQPLRLGNTALYSGYYRKDLRELVYSFDVDGFTSQDLSILSEHLLRPQVKQLAYAQNPDSVVWHVMDDGTCAGMTYERDQSVIAYHKHVFGGVFGSGAAVVESVTTIPATTRDETWLVIKRTIDGATVRYVERMSVGLDVTDDKEDATFLDSHLTYSGVATSTLSGLDHLEGETVKVWGDGAYQGEFVVASGAIDLGEVEVEQASVGLTYTSIMETLSPEMGAQGGVAQTRIGRVSEVFLRLYRSLGGRVGGADSVRLETILYRDTDDPMDTSPALFTGDKKVEIEMNWERGKRLRVEHSDPTPFTLLGLIYELKVHG
jgi:hypothetical protein